MTNKLPIGWTLKRLGDITERITRKNTINNNNVLTISAEHGFISQDKFFTKIVASKDLSKYILLYKGDFCYNKSYCRGYPYGVFRKLKNYDVGVATSLYIYFKIIEGDSTFFEYLFDVGTLNKQLSIISQEGVRNHGLLNVPIEDFFNMTVPFPPIEEQKRIAEILSTFDDLIENLNKLIEKKEIYKKGVMQRVLTGEVRFNGFTDEWKTVRIGDICEYKNGNSFENYIDENGKLFLITLDSITIDGRLKNNHKKINIDTKELLSKNDIVMILSDIAHGYFLGLTAVIDKDNCYVLNQRVALLKPNNIIVNSYFLSKLININQKYFKKYGQGSSQQNLQKKSVENFIVKIPSLEEQNKIAELLTLIDQDIDNLKQLLHLRKLQKKGLMQKLLTGEVRI
ncbi:restriction endonuclease subunit S [uncultured Brachyspira sp.]|uniref:restriction endonuclease subunit S n=1 Tax=uncultured Brachyspira sp. TaxID=221953 RepID=UPI00259652E7|nr:restriction endonuclease subunit S [uncultured Brachyspira sp.]